MKARVYYLNMDAAGMTYVSKKPMSPIYYATMAKLKCIPTKAKKITKKGVHIGAICITTKNDTLKIVEVESINGYERSWIKDGKLKQINP